MNFNKFKQVPPLIILLFSLQKATGQTWESLWSENADYALNLQSNLNDAITIAHSKSSVIVSMFETSATEKNFENNVNTAKTALLTISGKVVNDNDGILTGIEPGVAAVTVTLFAANGTTVLNSTTTDVNGNYTFSSVSAGGYVVGITPPSGYFNVSSTDLTTPTDGKTSVVMTGPDINAVNFGINQPPTASNVSQTIPTPTGFQITAGTIIQAVAGSDPGNGLLSIGSTVVITALPTNGVLVYAGAPIVISTPILNFNSSLLSVINIQPGSTSIQFGYTFIDAANLTGTSATFTISWADALPVEWGDITIKQTNEGTALVKWHTFIESNNRGFYIEHSIDAVKWEAIGFETSKAKLGNSTVALEYNFIHLKPQSGNNYYRLKQVDFDGNYVYTASQMLTIRFVINLFLVYPNPSFEKVYFQFNDPSQVTSIQLTDLYGRSIKTFNHYVDNISLSNMTQGTYFVRVNFKNYNIKVFKIFKE